MATAAPAPQPAAQPTGAPAPVQNQPEEPVNISTGAKLPIPVNGTGFTMTLPKPGGSIQPTVDGEGKPIDPNTGQLLPPPEPEEPKKVDKGPEYEPALYTPGLLVQGLSDRIKSAHTSPELLGPLDINSPTGRSGGVPKFPSTSAIPDGSPVRGVYDVVKKVVLNPLLQTGKKPFGNITGASSPYADSLYQASARLNALGAGAPKTPGLSLLANWAGGVAKDYFGGTGSIDTQGLQNQADQAFKAYQQMTT